MNSAERKPYDFVCIQKQWRACNCVVLLYIINVYIVPRRRHSDGIMMDNIYAKMLVYMNGMETALRLVNRSENRVIIINEANANHKTRGKNSYDVTLRMVCNKSNTLRTLCAQESCMNI